MAFISGNTFFQSSLLFKKSTDLRVNNLRILTIKNVEFSGYYFYMNTNVQEISDYYISVALKYQTERRKTVLAFSFYFYS